jgi:hypothetical protein
MIKQLLFLIILTQIVSCAVWQDEYFHPQAVGATVEKESCNGAVGPYNKLVYNFDDVEVILSVWSGQSDPKLSVTFKVFKSSYAIWPDQVINVYADGIEIQLQPKSFTRLRYVDRYVSGDIERKEYPFNTRMNRTDHEDSQRLYFREYFESYVNTFDLIKGQINEVKINKIKIVVQGKEHVLTDITFTKEKGVFLYPLNC